MDELHDGRGPGHLVEPHHVTAVHDLLGSHEPSLDTVARGRALLLAEATGAIATTAAPAPGATPATRDPGSVPKRRRGRRSRLVGAGLGLAAVAAVAVAAPAILSDDTTLVVPRPGTSVSATTGPTAQKILLAAAAAVATERTRSDGDYWRIETAGRSMLTDPTRGYVIEKSSSGELWLAKRPDLQSWRTRRYLGARPATPQDEAAWRAAGSPDSWSYPDPDIGGEVFSVPREPLRATADEPVVERLRGAWKGTAGDLATEPITWKEARAIPGEPDRLQAYLEERITRRLTADPDVAPGWEKNMDRFVRAACMNIISTLPVSPEARASAYRVLASLPGMRAEGEVTDPLGRRGQALGYRDEVGPGVFSEFRFVVDPGTGLPLADIQTHVTRLADGRQVEISHSTSYRTIGWTDERPPFARTD